MKNPLAARGPQLVRDTMGLSGLGLLSYGASLAWYPAGFIVGGGSMFILAIVSAWRGSLTAPRGPK